MAYTNFIGGTPFEVFTIFCIAVLGVYALGASIEGHMETPLGWPLRLLTAAAGLALIWPDTPLLEVGGAIVILGILAWSIMQDRKRQLAARTG
jgi:TRAP-type uncharacterized transport system fused permease subunit